MKRKTILKIIGTIIILSVTGVFLGQIYLEYKVKQALSSNLPDSIQLEYSDLNINLFQNYAEIKDVELLRLGETTKLPNLKANVSAIQLQGISLLKYVLDDEILIDKVEVLEPQVRYNHNKNIPKDEYEKTQTVQFSKNINIAELALKDGNLSIYDTQKDSLISSVKNLNISCFELQHNSETQNKIIPIQMESYSIDFDDMFLKLNDYENLRASTSNITSERSVIKALQLKTKYSKTELSRLIAVERDHYNLDIDSLSINQMDLGYKQDSTFYLNIPKAAFYQPDFNVYRDKLVKDDESVKPLYGKMLRQLSFNLAIDTMLVKRGNIIYAEKVREDRPAGEISFSNFNAQIENLGNCFSKSLKTVLHIETTFMDFAPLQVTWQFDVHDKADEFLFQAQMGKLQASNMNAFTVPNFNKRLKGNLDQTYFTIFGNSNTSQIDFKVKYNYFDIIALKKNGEEKNKLLSDVFNLFVSKNSGKGTNEFVEVTRQNIERNKTKSAFNYIWISTKSGLVKAMTIE